MTQQPDSRTPTLEELLRAAMDSRLSAVHTALPGRVERYDPLTQKADIQPLIKRRLVASDGTELVESLPLLPEVPILFPRSAGFFLSFPLAKGDLVLLIFAERSIEAYTAGPVPGVETDPDDFRMHDLGDAVAIPGFWPFASPLRSAHATNMALGTDGTGPQIHFDASLLHLGAWPAADFVAKATPAKSNDDILKTAMANLRAAINGWTPVPNDGGAALKAALATWLGQSETMAALATTKAKAT